MAARHLRSFHLFAIIGLLILGGAPAAGRQPKSVEYKIGPDDVLSVRLFDQDPKYSGDVTVRPDGKITLALIDDIDAGGRTTMELKATLTTAYAKYFAEPVVYVTAKEIRSRKIYISGPVRKPGMYYMNDSLNIIQFFALAGDLEDWADKKNIVIIRSEPLPNGKPDRVFFNYKKVLERGLVDPIPMLGPGDQVVVR